MDQRALFEALIAAEKVEDVSEALDTFKENATVEEVPFGDRQNIDRGISAARAESVSSYTALACRRSATSVTIWS